MVQKYITDYSKELKAIFHSDEGVEAVSEILSLLAIFSEPTGFREGLNNWGKYQETNADQEGSFNLIPYGKQGTGKELLVVFSKGGEEFDERLREAQDQCAIDYPGIIKGILLVTDYWDNEKFYQIRSATFEKLALKFNLVLAAAIWTGQSFGIQQILP